MKTETLKIVDPLEYGIEKEKAMNIEKSFIPKLMETEGFLKVYDNIINKEINEETCQEARELRLKLAKTRSGISAIHKSEKEFFLASGRYVDALKNKLTEPVKQMEQKLEEIEKYYESLEKKKLEELRDEREKQLIPFGTDTTFVSLEFMSEEQFRDFLDKEGLAFKTRQEQQRAIEEQQIETQRLDALEKERRYKSAALMSFFASDFDFRNTDDDVFNEEFNTATLKKQKEDEEREANRRELAKIKEEQEKKEAERRRVEEEKRVLFNERYERIKPYNNDAGLLMLSDLTEEEFNKILKSAKEKHGEQIKKEKELAELKKQQEAEKEKEVERIEAEKKAKMAPDVDKLRVLYSSLKNLRFPDVDSNEAKESIKKVKAGIETILFQLAKDAKKLK